MSLDEGKHLNQKQTEKHLMPPLGPRGLYADLSQSQSASSLSLTDQTIRFAIVSSAAVHNCIILF